MRQIEGEVEAKRWRRLNGKLPQRVGQGRAGSDLVEPLREQPHRGRGHAADRSCLLRQLAGNTLFSSAFGPSGRAE